MMEIIKIVLAALLGGGLTQLFNLLIHKKQTDCDVEKTTAEEWRQLYSDMKQELNNQKKENEKLRSEIETLKTKMIELATDIANYKQYDQYIKELERYTDHLLHTLKTIAGEDSYREAAKKRPKKIQFQFKYKEGELN